MLIFQKSWPHKAGNVQLSTKNILQYWVCSKQGAIALCNGRPMNMSASDIQHVFFCFVCVLPKLWQSCWLQQKKHNTHSEAQAGHAKAHKACLHTCAATWPRTPIPKTFRHCNPMQGWKATFRSQKKHHQQTQQTGYPTPIVRSPKNGTTKGKMQKLHCTRQP